MKRFARALSAILPAAACLIAACAHRPAGHALPPAVVPHAAWEAERPLGHPADAIRRNVGPGDALQFQDLRIVVIGTSLHGDSVATGADAARPPGRDDAWPRDSVRLLLTRADAREERTEAEGVALNWNGYHVAVVAIYGAGELGDGLVALEIARTASLPPEVAASTVAGDAALRLRVPHRITHVTLHHSGSAEPLRPEDDPVQKLRGLQAWGARDRNWWDVPYHFLIDLDGTVYEGRDWRYMGETNTSYDPAGHFLISVIGNYDRQEPTRAQIDAIADLMAWALIRFDLPIDRIGGHYDYADTDCPGRYLRAYLEDGTLERMVAERIDRAH